MRTTRILTVATLALLLALAPGCRSPKGSTKQEKRSSVMQFKQEALAQLYREKPEARAQVESAAGYAAFSNIGSKILMLATGSGFGVAVDNRSGKHTYMKMLEVGGGVGIGIKKYKAIYIFSDRSSFERFLRGEWQVEGDAQATARHKDKGAGAEAGLKSDQLVRPVVVYQFTDTGVALSAVATGTRYMPDPELN